MRRKIKIGTIEISEESNALVIPEIGINHNGNLKTAFEMFMQVIAEPELWEREIQKHFIDTESPTQ